MKYSEERRELAVKKLMPPSNMSIAQVAEETGIPESTLYYWRMQAREKGWVVPGDGKNPEAWCSADKFAVVVETAGLNEAELAEYCRRKGLYVEQIRAWRGACEQANANRAEQARREREQRQVERRRIRELERELKRKEQALAETAALLVLRKKAAAIWGEGEDE